jgi:hypothetical protein
LHEPTNWNDVFEGGRISISKTHVTGKEIDDFLNGIKEKFGVSIEETFDQETQGLTMKPLEMPAYIHYYKEKFKNERPVVLSDLTEDERAH